MKAKASAIISIIISAAVLSSACGRLRSEFQLNDIHAYSGRQDVVFTALSGNPGEELARMAPRHNLIAEFNSAVDNRPNPIDEENGPAEGGETESASDAETASEDNQSDQGTDNAEDKSKGESGEVASYGEEQTSSSESTEPTTTQAESTNQETTELATEDNLDVEVPVNPLYTPPVIDDEPGENIDTENEPPSVPENSESIDSGEDNTDNFGTNSTENTGGTSNSGGPVNTSDTGNTSYTGGTGNGGGTDNTSNSGSTEAQGNEERSSEEPESSDPETEPDNQLLGGEQPSEEPTSEDSTEEVYDGIVWTSTSVDVYGKATLFNEGTMILVPTYYGEQIKGGLQIVNDLGYNVSCVIIKDGFSSIGNGSFDCFYELTSVVIPDSVTYIGHWAFKDCYALVDLMIPSSVNYIEESAFHECRSLNSVTVPEGITIIRARTFEYCGFNHINLPSTLISIEEDAFLGTANLTSVTIPEGVTTINNHAFAMSGLTEIYLPSTISYISSDAFGTYFADSDPAPLTAVYYNGTKEQFDQIGGINGDMSLLNNATLYTND